jgi:hypothetical protein
MKLIDWTKLFEDYRGQWVALSDADNETVVGSGVTAKEALDQAHRNGFSNAAITFVPNETLIRLCANDIGPFVEDCNHERWDW